MLVYAALTHPGVHQVDTCRAYYAGNNLLVEVDIVLPPETPLRDSHDIGESLQIKLETLPMVERAFVHADYETLHRPEVIILSRYSYHIFISLSIRSCIASQFSRDLFPSSPQLASEIQIKNRGRMWTNARMMMPLKHLRKSPIQIEANP